MSCTAGQGLVSQGLAGSQPSVSLTLLLNKSSCARHTVRSNQQKHWVGADRAMQGDKWFMLKSPKLLVTFSKALLKAGEEAPC